MVDYYRQYELAARFPTVERDLIGEALVASAFADDGTDDGAPDEAAEAAGTEAEAEARTKPPKMMGGQTKKGYV